MAQTGVEKALVELETQFWQAVQDQDAAAAKRLTDDSCLVTGSQGVSRIDHKALEGMMRAGTHTLERFDLSEFDVRLLSKDVALIGYKVHEDPYVPNTGKKGTGEKLVGGMVIAIEPMLTLGGGEIVMDSDGYTFRTKDGSKAAHFEHTVLITDKSAIILTK